MIGLVFDECEYDWANWCDKAPILLWLPSICPSRPLSSTAQAAALRQTERGGKRKKKEKEKKKFSQAACLPPLRALSAPVIVRGRTQ